MSKAKQLIEMMCPAPAVEPKPGVKPNAPDRPPRRDRETRPNPFRRRDIRPGEEPRPKASKDSIGEAKRALLRQPVQGTSPGRAFNKAKAATSKNTPVRASGLKQPSCGTSPAKLAKK